MARELSSSAPPPTLPSRIVVGVVVILAGVVWTLAAPSLGWFGFTPIGLYRSLDQPPILLTMVGLWYTLRSRRRDEPAGLNEDIHR